MNSLILLAASPPAAPAIEPVIVTATRIETPVRDVLASVEVIRRRRTAAPARRRISATRCGCIPGVEVVRLGGPGQQTSLFIRGTESNHVLVLMDGLRINPERSATRRSRTSRRNSSSASRSSRARARRSMARKRSAASSTSSRDAAREDGSSVQAGFGQIRHAKRELQRRHRRRTRRCVDLRVAWIDSDGFPTRAAARRSTADTKTCRSPRGARGLSRRRTRSSRLACGGHDRILRISS